MSFFYPKCLQTNNKISNFTRKENNKQLKSERFVANFNWCKTKDCVFICLCYWHSLILSCSPSLAVIHLVELSFVPFSSSFSSHTNHSSTKKVSDIYLILFIFKVCMRTEYTADQAYTHFTYTYNHSSFDPYTYISIVYVGMCQNLTNVIAIGIKRNSDEWKKKVYTEHNLKVKRIIHINRNSFSNELNCIVSRNK